MIQNSNDALMHRRAMLRASMLGTSAAWAGISSVRPALAAALETVAQTEYGKVRGIVVDSVSVFKGIPYAGAAEGVRRFLPPSKPDKWTGVFDATRTGPRAVQGSGNL